MIKDLVRMIQLGMIELNNITDDSVRSQVEYELNKDA